MANSAPHVEADMRPRDSRSEEKYIGQNSPSVTKQPQKATERDGAEHSEFPHYQAIHDYAEAHSLDYACEFEERLRTLSPEQFQVLAVHGAQGMRRVILFSKR
jgi:hypothetical protein